MLDNIVSDNIKKPNRFQKIGLIIIATLLLILLAFLIYSNYFKAKNQVASNSTPVSTNISPKPVPIEDSYNLVIEKINITAPIIINVDGNDQAAYDKALEGGVAHLKGTALPGKAGNPFIFGHSSFYGWKPGDYKDIFATLNDLTIGDQIIISSNLSRYIYEITDKKTVMPEDVEVASQNYSEKKLTLMTCWPIGSDAKRLVVISNLKETIPIQ